MRPAALSRGAIPNAMRSDVRPASGMLALSANAAIPGRGSVRMLRTPVATRPRFSSSNGTMSATVPIAARSASRRHASPRPRREHSAATSLSATPAPASSGNGYEPSFGSVTGTPSGTRSPGSWWSVTTTSTPAARSWATSTAAETPQSTVTTRSGDAARMRFTECSVSP